MKIEIFIEDEGFQSSLLNDYFIAEYYLESKTSLKDAAWNLAIGQSVGNPSARSEFETDRLFKKHCCLILANKKELENSKKGIVKIAFPERNINFKADGVACLLVQLMGGQCDIDCISRCRLLNLTLTKKMERLLLGPAIGLREMKRLCRVEESKPLLGGIVKPKIGLTPKKLLELVKILIDGGCNFIKEDEILSNQNFCPLENRLPPIIDYINSLKRKVFYCVSIQADPDFLYEKALWISDLNGNGIHINFHCGFGIYKTVREQDLGLLMHFQKSGDRIITDPSNNFGIDESVIFELMSKSGCDTLHAGMIGGYYPKEHNKKTIGTVNKLRELNSVASLSCGMHPGIVNGIKEIIGHGDWMATVGGALFSHPMGTLAGVKAMRQAIDNETGQELDKALEKWGNK